MSLKLISSNLSCKEVDKINNDLVVDISDKRTNFSKQVVMYKLEGDLLTVPFSYGYKELGIPLPERKSFDSINLKFNGTLRDNQIQVESEAINLINKNKSCLISCHPGFGKCFGKGTRVLMRDFTSKNIEDIKEGDYVLDDMYKEQKVRGVCKGNEQMFLVSANKKRDKLWETGSFICNESHILTLKYMKTNDIVDISLSDYLKMEPKERNEYFYFKVPVEYDGYDITEEDIIITSLYYVYNHVKTIPNIILKNKISVRMKFLDILMTYNNNLIDYEHTLISLLKSLGYSYDKVGNDKIKITENRFSLISTFTVEPIYTTDEYYGIHIDGSGRFLLEDFTVVHNTFISLSMLSKINLKTMVIVNTVVLQNQWVCEIKKMLDGVRVAKLTSKSLPENLECKKKNFTTLKDTDILVINAQNIKKLCSEFYSSVGLVIVDEAHKIMAESLSNGLRMICPRYIIGLSATPYRHDGFNALLDMFFGKSKIIRELNKEHIVYKILTKFKPKVEYTYDGSLNWNSIINSQAENKQRNDLIIDIIIENLDKKIMILVKRVNAGQYLLEKLQDKNISCTSLLGNEQTYDRDATVLIGTNSKIGTGFDDSSRNCLILACDVKDYFVQYLGRVFRGGNSTPVIYDIVDEHSVLEKHFGLRKSVYLKHGGTIKTKTMMI